MLIKVFSDMQQILKNPLLITILRKGDTPVLASDACTSLPAGGTKLFLQRPSVEGSLPSFNFTCRLPENMSKWEPCEVEAYFVSQDILKNEHFL